MDLLFYVAGAVAMIATFLVITQKNAVHALLYLVVSLLAVAVMFFTLGAPFAAALEVIVYAGAIMVLFIFVVMMLNLPVQGSEHAGSAPKALLRPSAWVGPALLATALFVHLGYVMMFSAPETATGSVPIADILRSQQTLKGLSITLFGPYLLGVELASILLLAGLVGAYHLGHRDQPKFGER